jgi:hypothetical protein
MKATMSDNLRSDFGFFKLVPMLKSFGCEGSVLSNAITWFWKTSRTWAAATEEEFASIAKAELFRQFRPVVEDDSVKSYGQRWRERQAELAQRNDEVNAKFNDDVAFRRQLAGESHEARVKRLAGKSPKSWWPCQHWQSGMNAIA